MKDHFSWPSAKAFPILIRNQTNSALKHRDVFQQGNHAKDDHDDAHDLLGTAVERQQVDQIQNENNDEKCDNRTYSIRIPPIDAKNSKLSASALNAKPGSRVPRRNCPSLSA